jgi:probable O-glycosylation ligase (exosortase A-associated)
MRDALILSILAATLAAALFHPWIGVLGWTVISIMNPHRFAWAASDMPVALAMAVATLLGMVFTRDRVRLFVTPTIVVFVLFAAWMCVTLGFSMFFPTAFDMWKQVMKIDFMILVAMVLLHTRRQLIALVWVLVVSIGFYGVKGGVFTILTGGDYRVWGPPDSFIEGNNELALALVMTIPLMRFLQLQYRSPWVRNGLWLAMLLTATSALGTHSRGALLALIAMAVVLWTRTRFKLVSGVILLLIGFALIAFMPGQWDNRMVTITNYQSDESAMGRINAWWMAYNLARDRFFGGGFDIYRRVVFDRYAPVPDDVHAAHSIYFQVLGEHGFVGLALFLLLWLMVWGVASWLRRNGRRHPESVWTADLGAMVQASLAGYAVGGAFLSLAYFDLPYNLMLLLVLAKRWVRDKAWEAERTAEPAAHVPPVPTSPPT